MTASTASDLTIRLGATTEMLDIRRRLRELDGRVERPSTDRLAVAA